MRRPAYLLYAARVFEDEDSDADSAASEALGSDAQLSYTVARALERMVAALCTATYNNVTDKPQDCHLVDVTILADDVWQEHDPRANELRAT